MILKIMIEIETPFFRKLESQCISLVSFGTSSSDILDCPIWVSTNTFQAENIKKYSIFSLKYRQTKMHTMTKLNNTHFQKVLMVNVVAMEMLRTKIPPSESHKILHKDILRGGT